MPIPPKDPSRYETTDQYTLRITVLAPPELKGRTKPSRLTRNKIHYAIDEGFAQYLTLCGLEYRHREVLLLDEGTGATCGHCARVVAGVHRSNGGKK